MMWTIYMIAAAVTLILPVTGELNQMSFKTIDTRLNSVNVVQQLHASSIVECSLHCLTNKDYCKASAFIGQGDRNCLLLGNEGERVEVNGVVKTAQPANSSFLNVSHVALNTSHVAERDDDTSEGRSLFYNYY